MNLPHEGKYIQAVLNGMPDPVMVIGKDFVVARLNQAAEAAAADNNICFGGKHYCYEISHGRKTPCGSEGESCPVAEVFKTGKPFKAYHRHIKGVNSQAVIEISASPIFGETGNVVEVIEITRDVTDSEIAKKLITSQQKFKGLVESAPDAIVTVDADGTIIYANTSTTKIFGHTPDELIGKSLNILMPKDFPGMNANAVRRSADAHAFKLIGKTREQTGLRKDGSEFPIEFSVSSWNADGSIFFAVIIRDVTKRKRAEEAQQESRDWLNQIINCIGDPVFVKNDVHKFVLANDALCQLIGRSRAEILEKTDYDFFPRDQVDIFWKQDDFVLETGEENVNEEEITGKDGAIRAIRTKKMRYTDKAGNKYIVGVIGDITEHKQADGLLEERRQALLKEHDEMTRIFKLVAVAKKEWEMTMDCVSDMVVLLDHNDRIKRCNKPFITFVHKSYNDILGKDCIKLLREYGICIHSAHAEMIELYCEPARRWYVIKWYTVFSGAAGSDAEGMVITLHDSTDMKKVTQTLEQTNRKIEENRQALQSALDELSSLIQQVENEQTFNVRFQNPNLQKCYAAKNCTKTDCSAYGKEASRCWQVAGTHCGGAVQGAFVQKYKNCIECDVFKSATTNPIYQIGEHFNNMMNILELKNTELQNAYEELKLTQAKILQQEKLASIGQLAAGVAHEINNPMGFISSNLGTLDKYLARIIEYTGVLGAVAENLHDIAVDDRLKTERKRLKIDVIIDDVKKLISESQDGAGRVKTIVQNLKSFSRVDQSQSMDADINECLETTLNIVWNELKYKATVKKEFGALPRAWCYPQQLNQVFMNLLVNAGQALEKQGDITIRTWADNGSIFISVSDTGLGIPEKIISKIFEPFFTTKEVGKGTGLGLSITYDIVKKHNGDISVQSEPGKGSTFTVRIPVVGKTSNRGQEKANDG